MKDAVTSQSHYHFGRSEVESKVEPLHKPGQKQPLKSIQPVAQSHYAFYTSGTSSKANNKHIDQSKFKQRSILDGFIDPQVDIDSDYQGQDKENNQATRYQTQAVNSTLTGKHVSNRHQASRDYKSAIDAKNSQFVKYSSFNAVMHNDDHESRSKQSDVKDRRRDASKVFDHGKAEAKHFGTRRSDDISIDDDNGSSHNQIHEARFATHNDTHFGKGSGLKTSNKPEHLEPSHGTNYQVSSDINFTTPASNPNNHQIKNDHILEKSSLNQTPPPQNKPFDLGSARHRQGTHNLGSLLPQTTNSQKRDMSRRTPVAYEYTEDSKPANWQSRKPACNDADIDRILAKVKRTQQYNGRQPEASSNGQSNQGRDDHLSNMPSRLDPLQHMNQNMLSKYAGKPAAVSLTAFGRSSRLTN